MSLVNVSIAIYFKGAVNQARFTPRALTPSDFVKIPTGGAYSGELLAFRLPN
jgi:hypothetical protein